MICRPTGSPAEKPAGMLMPGRPARLTGMVQRSDRYMASGSAVRSPILKATVGEVGEMRKSKRPKARAKSWMMSVRVRWACA